MCVPRSNSQKINYTTALKLERFALLMTRGAVEKGDVRSTTSYDLLTTTMTTRDAKKKKVNTFLRGR